MKIGVSDPGVFKFSQQLIDHWKSQGHEVVKSLYHEPKFVEECDVVFYEYASVDVVQLTREGKKPKKCIVRAIDIENYMNYCDQFNWDLIDYFIVLNSAQRKLYTSRPNFGCPENKIRVIPPGVNLEKYTLKRGPKKKKAVFVGRLWIGKNVVGAMNVVYELDHLDHGWTLHIRGEKPDPRWWEKYVEHRVKTMGIKIVFDEKVENMNSYLENKDLMIVSSFKEAFSYAAAEAMAKGIPALINNWYGSDGVWPPEYIYNTSREAAHMALNGVGILPASVHREMIASKYDERFMFEAIERLMK